KELSARRVESSLELAKPPPKNKRQQRTCRKCYLSSCNGKGNVKYCVNKCRDCGKAGRDFTCKGRNPKFPKIPCTDAKWD
ncbi:hypothetical protein R3P38DRAFT_2414881, partial [Favolaschia claudopus]